MKKNVIIGSLGTTLDQGKSSTRWNKWRPSVSLCQHEELLVSTYHLLYPVSFKHLAERIVKDIEHVSPETIVVQHKTDISDPWDFEEVYSTYMDFADEMKFHPEHEDYLIHITTGTHVAQICMFLLTESRHFPGKLIQTSPPWKTKQGEVKDIAGTYTIIDLDLARYDRLAMRFQKQKTDDISFLKSGIKTKNRNFNLLIERIETVAIRSRDPILLTGPTGAGKSQLARRIYELRKLHHQVQGDFVEVNCATIRGDAAMSALFGHKKGSFTGAVKDRPGLLKTADNGMCFMDEVAELGSDEQAMLLRAIEKKTFLPLGADREESSDFSLICGTNKSLKDLAHLGKFRKDLLARINVWIFSLPSLKERVEDIEPNIEYELSRYAETSGRKISFSTEAKRMFLTFAVSKEALWESNFRDLNGAIRRMATLAPGGRITGDVVREEIARLKTRWQTESQENQPLLSRILSSSELDRIDLFERLCLEAVVKVCKESSSISRAGRKLYNVSREKKQHNNDADRLSKFLKRFHITWEDIRSL